MVTNILSTQKQSALTAHMSQVFNYMVAGVGLSGIVAYLTVHNAVLLNIALKGGLIWGIAWMAFGFFMHKIIFSLQPKQGLAVFAGFSALTGFAFAPIALVYTGASIATAFAVAAMMFGGASLYGYISKKSLSGWGNFLMMGAWGLMGLIVVQIVMSLFGSPLAGMSLLISALAVPLFAGMTAWETNQIKENFAAYGGNEVMRSRIAIFSATSLYMNFVVMFMHLLNLLGNRE